MVSQKKKTVASWEPPPEGLVLEKDDVHVWRVWLDAEDHAIARARATLSIEERARADRFLRLEHGNRFTLARHALRDLLGWYLRITPESVQFGYAEQGKPYLAGPHAASDIQFNISHSAHVALMAFSHAQAVGVDVEEFAPNRANMKIADRFFSEAERKALRDLPEEERATGFYACWTRKEAYLKARGDGLTLSLESFDVTLTPGEEPRLLRSDEDRGDIGRWKMAPLDPGEGFAGALVVENPRVNVRTFQYHMA